MKGKALYYGQPINRAHPPNRGLVAEWAVVPWYASGPRFIDVAGRNHGTLTNAPKWVGSVGRPGGFGALSFTAASSQYVAMPVNCPTGGPFSLACWFRFTTAATVQVMIGAASGSAPLFRIGSGNVLEYGKSGVAVTVSGGSTLSANTWYHGVITVAGSGANSTLYLNGKQDGQAVDNNATYTASVFWIGGRGDSSQYWGGLLDGAMYANRVWSASEVWHIYAESSRGNPSRWSWISPTTYFGVSAAPPATNRRRRVLMVSGSR